MRCKRGGHGGWDQGKERGRRKKGDQSLDTNRTTVKVIGKVRREEKRKKKKKEKKRKREFETRWYKQFKKGGCVDRKKVEG